jgi:hypothetical protein
MRHSLLVCTAIVFGCIVMGLLSAKTEAQPAAQSSASGRYQIVATDRQGAHARVFLCDTTTGQCWENRIDAKPWTDLGSPFQPAAKKAQ